MNGAQAGAEPPGRPPELLLAGITVVSAEAGIGGHVRFGHRVIRASWSSAAARWTVQALHGTVDS